MPDEGEFQDIKAGVDGSIGDVPSPSEADAPTPTETITEESEFWLKYSRI